MKTTCLCLITLVTLGTVACSSEEKNGEEKATAASNPSPAGDTPAAPAAAGSPKVGDSCKGISATDGKLGCEGKKVIFCSSYSNYEWKLQRECPDGQTCSMSADGKAANCK